MIYVGLAALFFGLTVVFIKLATREIHPLLGNLLFPAFAAIIQLIVLLYVKLKGTALFLSSKGIAISAIGGICLGLYTIFLFLALSRMNVSKVSPIVYIGAILIATIVGVIFLKEPLTKTNIAGLLLALSGLYLLFVR